ncbi:SLAM family member 5-like [Pluvialis apricaria]
MDRCHVCLFGVALLATAVGFADQAQPWQLNGVLGGSMLLSPVLPPNKTVKEIEWSFSAGVGATIPVAEFGPSGFERPDPKDRFKERLEMFNETALKIRDLERGDSGVYGARIKLHPALVEDQSFNLSVYGPVPEPEIHYQQLSLSTQGCNVTLRCLVPAGSDAEAAWQPGVPREQFCNDSQTLCLAVPRQRLQHQLHLHGPKSHRDAEYLHPSGHRVPAAGDAWLVEVALVSDPAGRGRGRGSPAQHRLAAEEEEEEESSQGSEYASLEISYAEIQRTTPPPADERVRLGGRGRIQLLTHCTVMPGPDSAPDPLHGDAGAGFGS